MSNPIPSDLTSAVAYFPPEVLSRLLSEVVGKLDLREVAHSLLNFAMESTGGISGSLAVMRDDHLVLAIINVEGRVYENVFFQMGDTLRKGLAGWVFNHRKPALVHDTEKDERWFKSSLVGETTRSAISVPILAEGQVVGVLTVGSKKADAFGEKELEFLQNVARVAGIALANALDYSASRRQARFMSALARSAAAIAETSDANEVVRQILEEARAAARVETLALARFLSDLNVFSITDAAGIGAEDLLGFRFRPQEGSGEGENCPSVDALAGLSGQAKACFVVHVKDAPTGLLIAISPPTGTFTPGERRFLQGAADLIGTALRRLQLFERLQSAYRQYRELFNDTLEWIFITDSKGMVVEANRRAKEYLGYRWEDFRSGTLPISAIHQIPDGVLPDDFSDIPAEPPIAYETVAFSKDGRSVPVRVYVRRVKMNSRPYFQWIMRDLTEHKRLEQLRNDLLAMIYHDIRSPLGNIVSGVEMLQSICEDEPAAQELLEIVKRASDSIRRLTDNLLEVGRMESGNLVLNKASARPKDLIADAVAVLQPKAHSKGQILKVSVPEGLPEVSCDADMIQRVLINLIGNAVKHTPAGTTIVVGARQVNEKEVLFWVQDNGPGIPREKQEHIFDKYARATTGVHGLGLGLAFCRMAVEAHGGKIGVESDDGKGAKFYFTLPINS